MWKRVDGEVKHEGREEEEGGGGGEWDGEGTVNREGVIKDAASCHVSKIPRPHCHLLRLESWCGG